MESSRRSVRVACQRGWATMMIGRHGGRVEVRWCEDEDEERCARGMAGPASQTEGPADFGEDGICQKVSRREDTVKRCSV